MPPHWSPGQPSFPRRPAPHNAGAGGEKTVPVNGCNAPLRRGLAHDPASPPQPSGGRDGTPDHGRFAGGKPGADRHRQVRWSTPPGTETPAVDRLQTWGIGRSAGANGRDAIQRHTLVWEGLEGATRPSMSMPAASKGLAIGWGAASMRSHANLGTTGGEFA